MSRTPNDVSGISIVADLMAMIKRSNVGVSLENDTHYGSEGILPSAAPRGWDALAPWQTARMVNAHQYAAQRVLPDFIAVLRYVDPCLGLPCRTRCPRPAECRSTSSSNPSPIPRCPRPAECRPKFISVIAWGARLRECSTPSIGFNLCEKCYNARRRVSTAYRTLADYTGE